MTDLRDRLTAAVPGWTIDYEADAAYLQLTTAPIIRTQSFGLVNLDLDADDHAVGIELLTLNPEQLPEPRRIQESQPEPEEAQPA